MLTVLRRALGQAEREGIVTRNVARLSAPQRIRARPGRALTVEQARQLLDAAVGYRFEAAVVLALTYGLRPGEVLGLRWSALDWQAGTLGVTHRVRRIKDRDTSSGRRTRLLVGQLKTPKSRRTLALTPRWWPCSGNIASARPRRRWRPGRAGRITGSSSLARSGRRWTRGTSRGCASGPGSATGIRTSCATPARR
jgi:integrase